MSSLSDLFQSASSQFKIVPPSFNFSKANSNGRPVVVEDMEHHPEHEEEEEHESVHVFEPRLPFRHFLAPWVVGCVSFALSILFFKHAAKIAQDDTDDTYTYYDIRYNYIAQMLTLTLGFVFLVASKFLFAAPILMRKKSHAKLVFDEVNQEVLIKKVWFCRMDQIFRSLCIRCGNPDFTVEEWHRTPQWLRALLSEKRFPMSSYAGSNVHFEHDILSDGDVRASWEVKFIVTEKGETNIKTYVLDETISKAASVEIA
jgi:hypothetical protein